MDDISRHISHQSEGIEPRHPSQTASVRQMGRDPEDAYPPRPRIKREASLALVLVLSVVLWALIIYFFSI